MHLQRSNSSLKFFHFLIKKSSLKSHYKISGVVSLVDILFKQATPSSESQEDDLKVPSLSMYMEGLETKDIIKIMDNYFHTYRMKDITFNDVRNN